MKNTLTIVLLMLTLVMVNAQTNVLNTNTVSLSTNVVSEAKEYGGYEITLGGSGSTVKNKSEGGLDFTLSSNPFKKAPQVWIGVAQSVYFAPSFSGSTDLYSDWNTQLTDKLYLNTGWSGGFVYDTKDASLLRTGPEVSLEYYTSDNSFIYVGANYDMVTKGSSGLRYSFGIGLAF